LCNEYYMASQYQPEFNHVEHFNQVPNVTIQPPIHRLPDVQPIPQQARQDRRFATQIPTHLPMPLIEDHPSSGTSISRSPQLSGLKIDHPTVDQPQKLDDYMAWNCYFLRQLQGNYEIETPDGPDQVSVILPTQAEVQKHFAIVRRVCSDGEALADRFIYQEQTRFILCSVGSSWREVEAVFGRGKNMRFGVKWENVDGYSSTVWRRKRDVTFNLESANSFLPSWRKSMCSIETPLSSCYSSPVIHPNFMDMLACPELLQQNSASQDRLQPTHGCRNDRVFNVSSDLNIENGTSFINIESNPWEKAMFELVKANCVRNPTFLRKMVHWAMKNRSMRRFSAEDVSSLSEGRIWIAAHPADYEDGAESKDYLKETLEEIKGAYQEVRTGVFMQPETRKYVPGVQNRLCKSLQGCWKIERYNVDTGEWDLCAEQQPDGVWVCIKNNREVIKVQLIPLRKILERLCKESAFYIQEVEERIEFLFRNCHQKKLNSKYKRWNLKFSISSLRMKIERQYALRFATVVATTADTIAHNM